MIREPLDTEQARAAYPDPQPSRACPTCGQPVTVVTSGEGTSSYRPAATEMLLRACDELDELRKRLGETQT